MQLSERRIQATWKLDPELQLCITTVRLYNPKTFDKWDTPNSKYVDVLTVWDTGANYSAITNEAAHNLGITPFATREIQSTAGSRIGNCYRAHLFFSGSSRVIITDLHFLDMEFDDFVRDKGRKPDVLIGMDIIAQGDFAISHNENKETVFSWRYPASGHAIDFTKPAMIN